VRKFRRGLEKLSDTDENSDSDFHDQEDNALLPGSGNNVIYVMSHLYYYSQKDVHLLNSYIRKS
jgi:hypothetical protein